MIPSTRRCWAACARSSTGSAQITSRGRMPLSVSACGQRRQPRIRLLLQPLVLGDQALLLSADRGQPIFQLAQGGDIARSQRALFALATERAKAALDLLLLPVDRIAFALDLLEPPVVRLDLAVDLQHPGERLEGRLVKIAILEEFAELIRRDAAHALPAAGLHTLVNHKRCFRAGWARHRPARQSLGLLGRRGGLG